jgi:hypothetical protein
LKRPKALMKRAKTMIIQMMLIKPLVVLALRELKILIKALINRRLSSNLAMLKVTEKKSRSSTHRFRLKKSRRVSLSRRMASKRENQVNPIRTSISISRRRRCSILLKVSLI